MMFTQNAYLSIFLLSIPVFTANAMDVPQSKKYHSVCEELRAYMAFRKQKEQEYLQKFPLESDVARYERYLQDLYPYCNAIEQMFKEDMQNAQKLLMDIWQIGGSDWYKFHSLVTSPPPLPFRLPHLSSKHRIVIAIACVGAPLIIGACYQGTRYIKKRYKKKKS